jgi:hypothetical protein
MGAHVNVGDRKNVRVPVIFSTHLDFASYTLPFESAACTAEHALDQIRKSLTRSRVIRHTGEDKHIYHEALPDRLI